jgi:hypothetical protein
MVKNTKAKDLKKKKLQSKENLAIKNISTSIKNKPIKKIEGQDKEKKSVKKESMISILIDKLLALFSSQSKKKTQSAKSTISPNKQSANNKSEIKKEIEEEEDVLDDLFVDYEEEKQDNKKTKKKIDEDENENVEEGEKKDEKMKSIKEKFLNKDGIKKPKSLKELQEEAKKKSDEKSGKSFSEGSAAKGDLKKIGDGHAKTLKKKPGPLDPKVFLIRGKDNGRPAWHYVLIPHENIKKLKVQKAGTNIDVTDFGKIIRSGWGENPSDAIVEEVEAEYGETQ